MKIEAENYVIDFTSLTVLLLETDAIRSHQEHNGGLKQVNEIAQNDVNDLNEILKAILIKFGLTD